MIITIASSKGGVSKTTSAIHLAAFLQSDAPTVLIDGDVNRSALGWSKRGSLSFPVVDERQAAKVARDYKHLVFDTPAGESAADLKALVDGCDLLIVPTTPNTMDVLATLTTVATLRKIGATRFKVMLAIVAPRPNRDGDEARSAIASEGLPIFVGSVRRAVAFSKASLAGSIVRDVADRSAWTCWNDYAEIGREILG